MQGHTKFVTAFAVDHATGAFYSGDYEGRMARTDLATGAATVLGAGHGNLVTAVAVANGCVVTARCAGTRIRGRHTWAQWLATGKWVGERGEPSCEASYQTAVFRGRAAWTTRCR